MKSRRIPTKKPLYLDGPKRGIKEIWFALKVGYSFLYNNYKLHNIGPGITVFGSARIPENSFYYKAATEFGRRIALMNFTTITGGGPGIMEAANKGAFEAGGRSVGMNIVLPHEQHENPYVTTSVIFEYFFTRKVMLVKHSYAFIVMPGGFGTMDEFFEILTLIQTKSTDRYPVILFGVEYYKVLIEMMNIMAQNGTIAEEDINLLLVTDSIDDAMEHIQRFIKDNFAVFPHRPRWRWLEKK